MYIIVDPLLLILRNAFSNPYDIPNLLLSQLDICVKDAVIELLLKRQSIQENFMLEKLVFHSLVTSCSIKEITIFLPPMVPINNPSSPRLHHLSSYLECFTGCLYLLIFIRCCQTCIAFWIESANSGKQISAFMFW